MCGHYVWRLCVEVMSGDATYYQVRAYAHVRDLSRACAPLSASANSCEQAWDHLCACVSVCADASVCKRVQTCMPWPPALSAEQLSLGWRAMTSASHLTRAACYDRPFGFLQIDLPTRINLMPCYYDLLVAITVACCAMLALLCLSWGYCWC